MLHPSAVTCFFANCDHPAVFGSSKCALHKHRTKCVVDQCANQVYARNLCVRHGGKKKCTFEDCQLNARIGEFCSKHGGKSSKAICTHEGCTKQAHKRKKCVRHGGGRKCNVDGCDVHARRGGYCARHGRQASDGSLAASPTLTSSSTLSHMDTSGAMQYPLGRLALGPRLGLAPGHALPPYNTAYRSPPSSAAAPHAFIHAPHHDASHEPYPRTTSFPPGSPLRRLHFPTPAHQFDSDYMYNQPPLRRDPDPLAPLYPLPPAPTTTSSVKLPALGFLHRGSPPTMAPVAYAALPSHGGNGHLPELNIRR